MPSGLALDILTRVINVAWASRGVFTYVSTATEELFQFWGVFGSSGDGESWRTNSHINTKRCTGLSDPPDRHQVSGGPATYLACSIRGKKIGGADVIVAGGAMGWPSFDTLGNPTMTTAAVVMYSADGGASWTDGEIPVGAAGLNQFNKSEVLVVGFNKATGLFYATSVDTMWDDITFLGRNYRTLSSATGGGWVPVAETFSPPGSIVPPLPYPDDTLVCSTIITDDPQPKLKFCTSCGANQILTFTAGDGKKHTLALSDLNVLLIDGNPVMVGAMSSGTAVTCGRGLIIFVGFSLDGNIQLQSSDLGESWQPVPGLAGLVPNDQSGFSPCITCS